jgi:stage II sporulation protein P
MIAVGEEAKRVFEENGIEVIHDKTIHDHPSFNGSYANSLKTVEKYKAKYPSISVVLDLHRDAFVYENGSKAKFVTEIDGQKVAQLMLVVGTNGGGLDHPEWRENMKLALKFQDEIIKEYPTLMRGVNLRKERFNGHTTYGSMIIEVGSSGNTLSEAIRGARLATERIAGFLNKL